MYRMQASAAKLLQAFQACLGYGAFGPRPFKQPETGSAKLGFDIDRTPTYT